MTFSEIVFAGAGAFFGYLFRALAVWAGEAAQARRSLGPRVISGVPLPCPSDPRWRESRKSKLTRTITPSFHLAVEEVKDVPVVRLGLLCVDESDGRLYVLREDGSSSAPVPGADGYAELVIRERQARRALESIAREEVPDPPR
jgi:hypothetical protein